MISYDMPQGQQKGKVKGSNLDLYDMIYDGDIPNQFLSGGLGQLTGALAYVEVVSKLSDLHERSCNTCSFTCVCGGMSAGRKRGGRGGGR